MIVVHNAWQSAYPGAALGLLVMEGVANPDSHPALAHRKEALETELRIRYSGKSREDISALPILQAYALYYRRFKKTYHVQLQLESLVFKGRSIPSVAALVEAMFMAELKNLLLTAGHDLDTLDLPVTLNVSAGGELYTVLRGHKQVMKPDDMFIADRQGIISSVIYGPDRRTQITRATRRVLFTVYAPPGVGAPTVRQHLEDIYENVLLISPYAQTERLEVHCAS